MNLKKTTPRAGVLVLILSLVFPYPTFALRPGAGLEEPSGPLRASLEQRLRANSSPLSRTSVSPPAAGLEEETLVGLKQKISETLEEIDGRLSEVQRSNARKASKSQRAVTAGTHWLRDLKEDLLGSLDSLDNVSGLITDRDRELIGRAQVVLKGARERLNPQKKKPSAGLEEGEYRVQFETSGQELRDGDFLPSGYLGVGLSPTREETRELAYALGLSLKGYEPLKVIQDTADPPSIWVQGIKEETRQRVIIQIAKASLPRVSVNPTFFPLIDETDKGIRVTIQVHPVPYTTVLTGYYKVVISIPRSHLKSPAAGLEEEKKPPGPPEFSQYDDFVARHNKIMEFAETAAFGKHQVGSGKESRQEVNRYFGEAIWATWTAIQVALSQVQPFFSHRGDIQILLNNDLENLARYYRAHYEERSGEVEVLPGAQAARWIHSLREAAAQIRWFDLFGSSLSWETVQRLFEQNLVASTIRFSGEQERMGIVLEKPADLMGKVQRKERLPSPTQLGENLYHIGARVFLGKGGKAFPHVQKGRIKAEQAIAREESLAKHSQSPSSGGGLAGELIYEITDGDTLLNHLRFVRHRLATLLRQGKYPYDQEMPQRPLVRPLKMTHEAAEDLLAKARLITAEHPFATGGDIETMIEEVFYFLRRYSDSPEPARQILARIDRNEDPTGKFAQAIALVVEQIQAGVQDLTQIHSKVLESFHAAGLEEWTVVDLKREINRTLREINKMIPKLLKGPAQKASRSNGTVITPGYRLLKKIQKDLAVSWHGLDAIPTHSADRDQEFVGLAQVVLKEAREQLAQQKKKLSTGLEEDAEGRQVLPIVRTIFGSKKAVEQFLSNVRDAVQSDKKVAILIQPGLIPGDDIESKRTWLYGIQGNLEYELGIQGKDRVELDLLTPETGDLLSYLYQSRYDQVVRVIRQEGTPDSEMLSGGSVLLVATRAFNEALRTSAANEPLTFRVDPQVYNNEIGRLQYPTFVVGLRKLFEAA